MKNRFNFAARRSPLAARQVFAALPVFEFVTFKFDSVHF